MTIRPKFTKALFLRLCAVGLFLSLGTFAVMHSLKGKANPAEQQVAAPGVNTDSGMQPADADSKPTEIMTASFDDSHDEKTALQSGTPIPETTPAFDSSGLLPKPVSTSPSTGGSFSADSKPPLPVAPSGSGLPKLAVPPAPSSRGTGAESDSSFSGNERSAFPPVRPAQPGSQPAIPPAFGAVENSRFTPTSSTPPNSSPVSNASIVPVRSGEAPGLMSSPATITRDADNPVAAISASQATSGAPPLRPVGSGNDLRNEPTTGIRDEGGSGFVPGPPSSTPRQPPVLMQSPVPLPSPAGLSGAFPGLSPAGIPSTAAKDASSPPRQEPGPVSGRQPDNSEKGGESNRNGFLSSKPPGEDRGTDFGTPAVADSKTNSMTTTAATGRPATSLAAAPIRSSANTMGSSTIAQPVPGDARFEGIQIPALAVQKIAPREVQVNREATFELLVKNTGRSSAENVQVYDYVPQGARFVSAVPGPSQNLDGQVIWDLGTLMPGQQVSIQMKIMPERAGDLGSVAHVTFGAQASARTVCTQPQLVIRHEAPDSVLIGQDAVLGISVENTGNGAAEDVVLQEDVPEGLEFSGGQRELEYAIGTLRPGETRNIQLRLRASQVGQVRNVLVVHGAGKLQADDVINMRIVAPQLTLQGDGPSRKFLNRPAVYTFSVGNQGTAPATNMQLVARLPRGLKFASANNQGQYDPAGHAVVWRLAKLDPQKTGIVELTTIPIATGNQEIQVQAIADLNQQQQTTRTMLVEQLSELFFDIDDSADAIEVGTGTTFQVRVANQGQIPATNVNVQVDFPDAIEPVSVEGNVRHQIRGKTVVLEPITSLAPGQEISFVIRAKAIAAGDHRTVMSVRSDDRDIAVSKEESTHVYSDRQ